MYDTDQWHYILGGVGTWVGPDLWHLCSVHRWRHRTLDGRGLRRAGIVSAPEGDLIRAVRRTRSASEVASSRRDFVSDRRRLRLSRVERSRSLKPGWKSPRWLPHMALMERRFGAAAIFHSTKRVHRCFWNENGGKTSIVLLGFSNLIEDINLATAQNTVLTEGKTGCQSRAKFGPFHGWRIGDDDSAPLSSHGPWASKWIDPIQIRRRRPHPHQGSIHDQ